MFRNTWDKVTPLPASHLKMLSALSNNGSQRAGDPKVSDQAFARSAALELTHTGPEPQKQIRQRRIKGGQRPCCGGGDGWQGWAWGYICSIILFLSQMGKS